MSILIIDKYRSYRQTVDKRKKKMFDKKREREREKWKGREGGGN